MASAVKPPPIALALLAIGALWWLTQRRAVAGTGNPVYGQQAAITNPAVQRYNVPPSGVIPGTPATPLQSVLQFASSLISSNRGAGAPATSPSPAREIAQAYSYGGPSTGVYGATDTTRLAQAYSYGGPSTGVYGVDPVPSSLTSMASSPWTISQPDLGGYGYMDGAGVADQVAASYAPNVDWSALAANETAYLLENPFALSAF